MMQLGSFLYLLTIHFSFFVGAQPLRLSTAYYKNQFGESFSVQQCKYYISAIRVTSADGTTQTLFAGSHLVDAADSSTLTLQIPTSSDQITAIRFIIGVRTGVDSGTGVDSAANTNGVQTGDLDPMLGMFWTWNTGYIYARLEGTSDSAHAPAHRFTWDVGGYRPGANATREITLSLPAANMPAAEVQSSSASAPLPPPAGASSRALEIRADLLRWFDGRHPIHLAQSPICHQPGPLAMQLADNYATMFSIAP
jgi:hypothetical protein